MINISGMNRSKCSGCCACVNVCPKLCISMELDQEGFYYPVVDEQKCVKCGLCEKTCKLTKSLKSENNPVAYACYNSDEKIRIKSSSGGMFTIFAEIILDSGGIVFGAAFDSDLSVHHICVDNKEDLHKLRGSKYVQSFIGESYKQAKEFLKSGRPVLFSGTPCQIAGLHQYLGDKYDNLYTVDIICHGVASLKVWKAYLEYLEKIHKNKVDVAKYPSFRSKKQGYLDYGMEVYFENGVMYNETISSDKFMGLYLTNRILRPSCYRCDFKGVKRNSDITLADFWGVDKLMPKMFDNKGTSLVLVNTLKGNKLFEEAKAESVYQQTEIKLVIPHNLSAVISTPKPFCRDKVFEDLDNVSPTDFFCNISYKKSFFEKVFQKLKYIYKKYTVKY